MSSRGGDGQDWKESQKKPRSSDDGTQHQHNVRNDGLVLLLKTDFGFSVFNKLCNNEL